MNHSTYKRIASHFLKAIVFAIVPHVVGQIPDSLRVMAPGDSAVANISATPLDSSLTIQPQAAPVEIKEQKKARYTRTPYELTAAYSERDQLKQKRLAREQARIRVQLDILNNQLLFIDEKLQDSKTRIALAKKVNDPKTPPDEVSETGTDRAEDKPREITPRAIDLAAVTLIRKEGLSLDQARLQIIESLSTKQVADFYSSLDRSQRYELYDLIDTALENEEVDFELARKSAIFFHFYAQ